MSSTEIGRSFLSLILCLSSFWGVFKVEIPVVSSRNIFYADVCKGVDSRTVDLDRFFAMYNVKVRLDEAVSRGEVRFVQIKRPEGIPMQGVGGISDKQFLSDSDSLLIDYLSNAISLVGRVRYVWGGGHRESSVIGLEGVRLWEAYNSLFGDSGKGVIPHVKPKHYQPVMSYEAKVADFLAFKGVYAGAFKDKEFVGCLEGLNNGYLDFRFEGLDCSGFCNVVLNSLGLGERFDYLAADFGTDTRLVGVDEGSEYRAGDLVSWGDHIVVVVGKYVEGVEPVYITVESTVGVLRFGVVYHQGASDSVVKEAEAYANASNAERGINVYTNKAAVYNLDEKGFPFVSDLLLTKLSFDFDFGFLHSNGVLNGNEILAKLRDIIQYVDMLESSSVKQEISSITGVSGGEGVELVSSGGQGSDVDEVSSSDLSVGVGVGGTAGTDGSFDVGDMGGGMSVHYDLTALRVSADELSSILTELSSGEFDVDYRHFLNVLISLKSELLNAAGSEYFSFFDSYSDYYTSNGVLDELVHIVKNAYNTASNPKNRVFEVLRLKALIDARLGGMPAKDILRILRGKV